MQTIFMLEHSLRVSAFRNSSKCDSFATRIDIDKSHEKFHTRSNEISRLARHYFSPQSTFTLVVTPLVTVTG